MGRLINLVTPALLFLLGCGYDMRLPSEREVAPTSATSIDGEWTGFSRPFAGLSVRLDRGRLYTLDLRAIGNEEVLPGSVIAKNFRQVGPTKFECDYAVLPTFRAIFATPGMFVPAVAEINTDRSLVFHVPVRNSGGEPTGFEADGDQVFIRAKGAGGLLAAGTKPLSVTIDPAPTRKAIETEFVEVPPGGIYRSRRSRTVEHVVDINLDTALHGELSIDALGFMKAAVKGDIERKYGRSFKESETIEKEISLDGSRGRRYKITWYGTYATGQVDLQENNAHASIPFTFTIGEEFSATLVD